MAASFGWGALAASSLILGGLLTFWIPIGRRTLGLVMAFGSGVLISAVAFELVQEAFDTAAWSGGVALGLLLGSVVFFAGDSLIDRLGGGDRKDPGGKQAAGSGLAILLGILLDGIPESAVLGLTVLQAGAVSAAFLVAVFLSNLPGAILTMLADTMMPEAYEHGGKLVGLVTTLGFALAFAISALE